MVKFCLIPQVCLRNADICVREVSDVSEILLRYVWHMPEIILRYPLDMSDTCQINV